MSAPCPEKLYLATLNPHKIAELRCMLLAERLPLEVVSAETIGGMPEVRETASSFEGNARLKAQALRSAIPENCCVLSDDSGLLVRAVNDEPGVRSARYAGDDSDDDRNITKLLATMRRVPRKDRQARFICCLVASDFFGNEAIFVGECRGWIADASRGSHGFGYDPVFIPDGFHHTFAELGSSVKDQISHRARALRQFVVWLRLKIEPTGE